MTKRDFIQRYFLIIRKLRNNRKVTFVEIKAFIELEFELLGDVKTISKRTFQRDINEIRSLFNIDIQCDNNGQYYIEEDDFSGFNNRIIEGFDWFSPLLFGQFTFQLQ